MLLLHNCAILSEEPGSTLSLMHSKRKPSLLVCPLVQSIKWCYSIILIRPLNGQTSASPPLLSRPISLCPHVFSFVSFHQYVIDNQSILRTLEQDITALWGDLAWVSSTPPHSTQLAIRDTHKTCSHVCVIVPRRC